MVGAKMASSCLPSSMHYMPWRIEGYSCWDFYSQAHGTFVCGKNGGGVAEEFNCEGDVDICIGTLSKAAGCHGGFIACR